MQFKFSRILFRVFFDFTTASRFYNAALSFQIAVLTGLRISYLPDGVPGQTRAAGASCD